MLNYIFRSFDDVRRRSRTFYIHKTSSSNVQERSTSFNFIQRIVGRVKLNINALILLDLYFYFIFNLET